MKHWATVIVVLTSLCAAHAHAQPALAPEHATFSLQEVVREVSDAFPKLLSTRKNEAIAEAELRSARGGFDPLWRTRASSVIDGYYTTRRVDTVVTQPTPLWGTTLFAGYRYGDGNFAVYDGKAQTLSHGEVRAGVNLPVLRDGPIDSRRAELWSAKLGPEIAKAEVEAMLLEVVRDATLRYWTWVEAGSFLRLQRKMLRLAEERDRALLERVARGDIGEIELRDNRRAIIQRTSAVVTADRAFKSATLQLGYFLNPERDLSLLSVPALPEPPETLRPPLAADMSRALAQRPEFRILAAQRHQLEIEAKAQGNQTLPALDVQATVARDFGQGPEALRPTEVELSVYLDVPLLARDARGKRDSAQAKREKLQLEINLLRRRISADVNEARIAERAARERLALARREVELAREVADAELEALRLGTSSILMVNLREQAVLDAAGREIAALADCHRARAVYEAVLAILPAELKS